ncbi:S9 family peptidase [Caulobacter sp. 602-2]|uniref:S9 family peptidase n=1 Tax=Caulobacter sp. 602-2 TaxID=2710887 RepID=A0A6G4QYK9_9CAUL|nr:S9 family peptidase [Caulobacter sp. 602-2]NGM50018.1 S9 family peptidase [Caulobacter sp. 602-2]
MLSRRAVLAAAMGLPLSSILLEVEEAQAATTTATPPTIDEMLKTPLVRGASLSPDGQTIAMLAGREVDGKTVASVTFLNAADPANNPRTLKIGVFDIDGIAWANDGRLLIWWRSKSHGENTATGSLLETRFDTPDVRRILAVNTDGGDAVVLFGENARKVSENYDLSYVIDMLRDDPRNILMAAWDVDWSVLALYSVDVYTGVATLIERGVASTYGWFTQNGTPVLRYDVNGRGTVLTIYARAPGAKAWTQVRKIRKSDWKNLDFDVLAGTPEPGVLLVSAVPEGGDMRVLRRFDLRTLQFGETVAQSPGRDLDGAFLDDKGNFLGARYVDDRVSYQFLDPKTTAHHKAMTSFFGGEANVELIEASKDGQRYLALVSGPRMPGSYFFYDKQAKRFEPIGDRSPWLTEDRLAKMDILDVAARDGTKLRAYLTKPNKPGPWPLVVMPHGGPEARDAYDFDTYGQVFAARGWAVLQVNFRGSGGYGAAFAEAGRKHWGDLMQEDVEDAVAQVIAGGSVRADRVAICGASYGGYAALMGAVRKPDLYKSVVAIAGDADLIESIAFSKAEDGADSPAYAYWLRTIGDPAVDRQMMMRASPALRAAEIKAPVLLVHGLKDTIVSAKQSKIMAAALRKAGKSVEHVELRDSGHRGWEPEVYKSVLTKAVEHLSRTLDA